MEKLTQSRTGGQISVDKLMKTLSEILSDKYGAKITLTARPKEEVAA